MASTRSRFVLKALIAGLSVYAVLRLAMLASMNHAEPISLASGFWFQMLLPIVAGYVAGFVAKHDGLSHGALVGASIPAIESIGFAIVTSNLSVGFQLLGLLGVMWVVVSVLFGGLGGFIWDVQSKSRDSAP
jgi:hypothetical protein